MTYNLSIYTADGTAYGCISSDLEQLRKFLLQYDHEGSSIDLIAHAVPGEMDFVTIGDPEDIYKELGLTK